MGLTSFCERLRGAIDRHRRRLRTFFFDFFWPSLVPVLLAEHGWDSWRVHHRCGGRGDDNSLDVCAVVNLVRRETFKDKE